MKNLFFFTTPFLAVCSVAAAEPVFDQVPANSKVVVEETFDVPLADAWKTNAGSWSVVDGVLVGEEVAADKHAAAARRVIRTKNAVYQMAFKLSPSTRAFHFGFDPERGSLDKRGHLFSVVSSSDAVRIIKHVDKNRPKEDPSEELAKLDIELPADQWHRLRVVCWETYVTVHINDSTIKAEHPTFNVPKPTLVFRVSGDAVRIDDLKVWTPES